jgi:hypothetical protein
MPVREPHIGIGEVGKELLRAPCRHVRAGWRAFFDAVVDQVPVDGRDGLAELLLCFFQAETVDMAVDAAGFEFCWNTASHPGGATGELIVGCEDGPVAGIAEGDEAVDSPNGCIVEIGLCEGLQMAILKPVAMSIGVAVSMAIRVTICVSIDVSVDWTLTFRSISISIRPGSWDLVEVGSV